MKRFALQIWQEEEGFLTFEWTLLVTLMSIGVVSGLAAVRDATVDELGDVTQAILGLDQSYTISHPLSVWVHIGPSSAGADSRFNDRFPHFEHCSRTDYRGEGSVTDCGRVGDHF
ncbi:MAG: hypothetical protein K8T25_20415 [Planctomycetia bacterium]|nr:hypothetical protein [Planctomycetia bacterium]